MAEEKLIRLGQASRKLNVGHNTILDFLAKKGFSVENNPNAKLSPEQFAMLSKEFASSASEKAEASGLTIGVKHIEVAPAKPEPEVHRKKVEEEDSVLIKNLGSKEIFKPKEEPKAEKVELDKIPRAVGGVDAGATGEIGVRGLIEVQETNGGWGDVGLSRGRPARVVLKREVKAQAKIIVARESCAERPVKIAVRLRRIPGSTEVVVG